MPPTVYTAFDSGSPAGTSPNGAAKRQSSLLTNDDDDALRFAAPGTGRLVVVPQPSVEITPSHSTKGLVHIGVLPRTLPISSTHGGRPFKLLICINENEYLDTSSFFVSIFRLLVFVSVTA